MDHGLIPFIGCKGPRFTMRILEQPHARFTVHCHTRQGIESLRYTGHVDRFGTFIADGRRPEWSFSESRWN